MQNSDVVCDSVLCLHGENSLLIDSGIQPTAKQLLGTVKPAGAHINDNAVDHRPTVLDARVFKVTSSKLDFPLRTDNYRKAGRRDRAAGRRDQAVNQHDQTTAQHDACNERRANDRRLLYTYWPDSRMRLSTIDEQGEDSTDETTKLSLFDTAENSQQRDMTMPLISSGIFSDCLSERTTPTASTDARSAYLVPIYARYGLENKRQSISKVQKTVGDRPSCDETSRAENGEHPSCNNGVDQQSTHNKIAVQDVLISAFSATPRRSSVVTNEESCMFTEASTSSVLRCPFSR